MKRVTRKNKSRPGSPDRSKTIGFAVFLVLVIAHTAPVSAQAPCEDVSGVWTVDLVLPGSGSSQVTLTLEQAECAVTGLIEGRQTTPFEDGEVEGSTVTFTAMATNQANGQGLAVVWEGTVDQNAISGTLSSPLMGTYEFTGTKVEG